MRPEEAPRPQPKVIKEVLDGTRLPYLIAITKTCPDDIAAKLQGLDTPEKIENMIGSLNRAPFTSRRKMFFSPVFGKERAILKHKATLQPESDTHKGLKVPFFTTSVIHEIRTSYTLQKILKDKLARLPATTLLNNTEYTLSYHGQEPWAAIVNTKDQTQRYEIFEFITGTSLRQEAVNSTNGSNLWNDIPENLRILYGRIHSVLSELQHACLAHGLEPWDLGVHQVIYSIDEEKKHLSLTIIDTEEYNSTTYGRFWPEAWVQIGLPPVLLYMMMGF